MYLFLTLFLGSHIKKSANERLLCVSICTVINVLYRNYIWWEQMCRLIGVSSSPSSAPAPIPASHPYYLSWQYNQCFLPMLLNVFLLALIASFSLHCNSKWVWQITTIYLPRYTGFLYHTQSTAPLHSVILGLYRFQRSQ